MAGNKLIQTIQSMAKPPIGETTDLLFGEVTSVSPLKIRIDNRFEVDEQFNIIDDGKRDHHSYTNQGDLSILILTNTYANWWTGPHTHIIPEMTTYSALPSITLWRGLIVGDKVRLLRVNNGQMFYIIEREEGVV